MKLKDYINEDKFDKDFDASLLIPIYEELFRQKKKILKIFRSNIQRKINDARGKKDLFDTKEGTKNWDNMIKKRNKFIKILTKLTDAMLEFRKQFPDRNFNPPPGMWHDDWTNTTPLFGEKGDLNKG